MWNVRLVANSDFIKKSKEFLISTLAWFVAKKTQETWGHGKGNIYYTFDLEKDVVECGWMQNWDWENSVSDQQGFY